MTVTAGTGVAVGLVLLEELLEPPELLPELPELFEEPLELSLLEEELLLGAEVGFGVGLLFRGARVALIVATGSWCGTSFKAIC